MMEYLVFYSILAPFVGAFLAYIFGKMATKVAFFIAEVITLSSLLSVLFLFFSNTLPIDIAIHWFDFGDKSIDFGLYIDKLSMVMLLIVTGLGFLVIHFSHEYMAADTHQPRYYSFMLFFLGGMLLLVSAKELSGLFVGWEFMGLASYLLISFWHEEKAPADAGVSAFLYTKFGDIFLFASIGLLYHYAGTLDMIRINHLATDGKINFHVSYIIALFIFVAAIGKSGQFPLFPWLMRAMEGPTPVSALIHGATMVNSGIYIVARLFDFYTAAHALIIVATLAALSAFIGASSALVQKEMKKVLAYSTMSHLALAFVGLGVGSLAAGMMHLVNHAVFKALMFLGAGAVMVSAHHVKDMWRFGGLLKKMPLLALFMGMGALSLSGVPPFSGFFSKEAIFDGVIKNPQTHGAIAVITIIAGLLSMAYIARLWVLLFSGKPRDEKLFEEMKPLAKFWVLLPLGILAAITLLLGFFQNTIAHFLAKKPLVHIHFSLSFMAIMAALVALFLIVYYFYKKRLDLTAKITAQPLMQSIHKVLYNGYYVEKMIDWFVHHIIVNALAKMIAFIDKRIIDAFVNGALPALRGAHRYLQKTDTKKSGDYTGMMILGIAFVLFFVMFGGAL